MQTSHPVYGDLVTANRLVRGGRWVFRGTIVPLDDVLADFDAGMTLEDVWEKHGALEWTDLKAVAARASEVGATLLCRPFEERRRASKSESGLSRAKA